MQIRRYAKEDCREIMNLFYDTVHSVNAKDYTDVQLAAWAPAVDEIDSDKWNKSLSEHFTVVAVEKNIIVGFGDLDRTGYYNRLFVHKDYQYQGIASKISNELEKYASSSGFLLITVEASITAKSFFEKRGYQVIKEQQVERKGQILINYLMQKNMR